MMTDENFYRKYKSYSIEELLQDDEFIALLRYDGVELTDMQDRLADGKNPANTGNIEFARYFMDSVQVKSEIIRPDEVREVWRSIETINAESRRRKAKRFTVFYALAAGIVAAVAVLTVFSPWKGLEGVPLVDRLSAMTAVDSNAKDIQLVLSENDILSLEGNDVEVAYNPAGLSINNHSTEMNYRSAPATGSSAGINRLVVPYGKRSKVSLVDGTQIWVNAGSRIAYPVSFDSNRREIYVDGEVFLDVTRDVRRPFIVHTKNMDIEVLGTHFNIMAYERDSFRNIVLVDGSVRIKHVGTSKEAILKPSEMFSSVNGLSSVSKVDVERYIAWRTGMYKFSGESLDVIFNRLSRYYGREINYSSDIAGLRCSGKLDLKNNLQDVLRAISRTAPITFSHDSCEKYTIINKINGMPME